jgi:hypothetical protein
MRSALQKTALDGHLGSALASIHKTRENREFENLRQRAQVIFKSSMENGHLLQAHGIIRDGHFASSSSACIPDVVESITQDSCRLASGKQSPVALEHNVSPVKPATQKADARPPRNFRKQSSRFIDNGLEPTKGESSTQLDPQASFHVSRTNDREAKSGPFAIDIGGRPQSPATLLPPVKPPSRKKAVRPERRSNSIGCHRSAMIIDLDNFKKSGSTSSLGVDLRFQSKYALFRARHMGCQECGIW